MMRKTSILLAAAAIAFAGQAQAEVVSVEEDAFVTRSAAVVKSDLRATWLALISPAKWWNSSHTFSGDAANMTLTPQAGGCFCEKVPGEDTKAKIGLDGSVEHMSVILAMPDQALRMRGSLGPLQSEPVEGIMTITLSETKGGTRIVLEYAVGGFMRYEGPTIAKAVDGVMIQQLTGLAELLGVVEAPKGAEKPAEGKKPSSGSKTGTTDSKSNGDDDKAEGEDADASSDKVEGGKGSSEETKGKSEPKISVDEAFGDLAGNLAGGLSGVAGSDPSGDDQR